MGSRPDSGMTLRAAAVIAALCTSAGAADLLPPSSPRHQPHRLHLPVVPPPAQRPRASPPVPSGERSDGAISGWGTNSTSSEASVPFSTDPSGTIGGSRFDAKYQFSPNWLSGTEVGR
jgi:hypothetical protein